MTALQLVEGSASGEVLACAEGLSFWGGVDPLTGRIIDVHHPDHGKSVTGKVLTMPTSRGSCSGSGVLLELALNGLAPAALVFSEDEETLTLGALVAGRVFGTSCQHQAGNRDTELSCDTENHDVWDELFGAESAAS